MRHVNLLQLFPLVPPHIFEVHGRISCRCEKRVEESLMLQVILASNTPVHLLPIAMVHLPDFARK